MVGETETPTAQVSDCKCDSQLVTVFTKENEERKEEVPVAKKAESARARRRRAKKNKPHKGREDSVNVQFSSYLIVSFLFYFLRCLIRIAGRTENRDRCKRGSAKGTGATRSRKEGTGTKSRRGEDSSRKKGGRTKGTRDKGTRKGRIGKEGGRKARSREKSRGKEERKGDG